MPKARMASILTANANRHSIDLIGRAESAGIEHDLLEKILSMEVIPDPEVFLKVRKILQLTPEHASKLNSAYIEVLARRRSRPRTSNINKRHVIRPGLPDPLAAESAEELVEKLREVYRWALQPSLRELEERTGWVLKKSTISDMLHPARKTLTRFDRYALFLEACGVADMTYWITAYRKLAPPTRRSAHVDEFALASYEARQRLRASQTGG
ncbi:hypothetical protein [Streptomyces tauricus]|uniref:hypothetical protein n=1 Tax=Streptomyces tauricus TaxID=68274 RepID=UPI0033A4C161